MDLDNAALMEQLAKDPAKLTQPIKVAASVQWGMLLNNNRRADSCWIAPCLLRSQVDFQCRSTFSAGGQGVRLTAQDGAVSLAFRTCAAAINTDRGGTCHAHKPPPSRSSLTPVSAAGGAGNRGSAGSSAMLLTAACTGKVCLALQLVPSGMPCWLCTCTTSDCAMTCGCRQHRLGQTSTFCCRQWSSSAPHLTCLPVSAGSGRQVRPAASLPEDTGPGQAAH